MAHPHNIADRDPYFVIDPVTRAIVNKTNKKITLMQFDHNSERFTFEIPQMIEGHDMSLCNRIEVHYLNIEAATKITNADVYEIKDAQVIGSGNDAVVIGSWLISQNATKLVGNLSFIVRYACTAADGTLEYVWSSAIYSAINISNGIYNSEDIVEQYADVLEQWKAELEELANGGGTAKEDAARKPVILALGDSLCAGIRNNGKGYVGDLGLPYVNKGRNMATLGGNPYVSNDDRTKTLLIRNQLIEAHDEGVQPDIIIANGGVNDYGVNAKLGEIPAQMATSEDYFTPGKLSETLGGLEKLFFDMWQLYPEARKLFVLSHKMNRVILADGEPLDFTTTPNDPGYTQKDYVDGIKATCEVYKIEVVDVYNGEIDMQDDKYISNFVWNDIANDPQRFLLTANEWLEKDGHPFSYGYIHGYLPLIHEALFRDVSGDAIASDKLFFVPIKYDGKGTFTSYTLDGITGADIENAHQEGKYLVAKVSFGDAVFYAPLVSRTKTNTEGWYKYDFTNAYTTNPQGRGVYTVSTNGTGVVIMWAATPATSAKNVACDVTIGGEQQTNVADALSALAVSGGGNWELIAEHNEPITGVHTVEIASDSNGEPFKLKEAVLLLAVTTKGGYGYLSSSVNNGIVANTTNTINNALFRLHYKKDIDGAWVCYGYVGTLTGNYETHKSHGGSIAKSSYLFDEFINKLKFSHGDGAEFARYKLYGIRG